MRKQISLILSACIIGTTIPAYAALPNPKLPTLPAIEQPKLSNDYNKMTEELGKQGYGQYKYDPNKKLDFPDVEAPQGTGKNAETKFKESYGDMWNSKDHQLDKSSKMPKDDFFKNHAQSFGEENQKLFNQKVNADQSSMNQIKQSQSVAPSSSAGSALSAPKSSLKSATPSLSGGGSLKPAGWDSVQSASTKQLPKINTNIGLTSGDHTGVKGLASLIPGGVGKSAYNGVAGMVDKWKKDSSQYKSDVNNLNKKIKNGTATEADKKKVRDSAFHKALSFDVFKNKL